MTTTGLRLIPYDAKSIGVAVIGMGQMGSYHTRAVQTLRMGAVERYYKGSVRQLLGKLRLAGLVDRQRERLIGYDGVAVYDEVTGLMAGARPDIAIVATPTVTHGAITEMLLKAGVHCLVEKPIATDMEQWKRLRGLAESKGVRLLAGHVERYNPVAITVRERLAQRGAGVLRYAFSRCQRHDARIPDSILVDKVIHDLDLSLCFFGGLNDVAVLDIKRQDGVIYEARLKTEHTNGAEGTLLVSWLVEHDAKERRIVIEGDGMKLEGDFAEKRLWENGKETACQVANWIDAENNQLKDQIADFVNHCCEIPEGEKRYEPLLSVEEIEETTYWLDKMIGATETM